MQVYVRNKNISNHDIYLNEKLIMVPKSLLDLNSYFQFQVPGLPEENIKRSLKY